MSPAELSIGLALGAAVTVAWMLAMIELASCGVMVVTLVVSPRLALMVAVADEDTRPEPKAAAAEDAEAIAALALITAELESELESELELELDAVPVRAMEPRSSGTVSMKAMVGPATTEFVSWSRMLFAKGWVLFVI